MTPLAPARTVAQRTDALAYANAIRSTRKEFKRRLTADPTLQLLLDTLTTGAPDLGTFQGPHGPMRAPKNWLDTMPVRQVLLRSPKLGGTKVNRLLTTARVSPAKTMAGLTQRQRFELVHLVEEFCHRSEATRAARRAAGLPTAPGSSNPWELVA